MSRFTQTLARQQKKPIGVLLSPNSDYEVGGTIGQRKRYLRINLDFTQLCKR